MPLRSRSRCSSSRQEGIGVAGDGTQPIEFRIVARRRSRRRRAGSARARASMACSSSACCVAVLADLAAQALRAAVNRRARARRALQAARPASRRSCTRSRGRAERSAMRARIALQIADGPQLLAQRLEAARVGERRRARDSARAAARALAAAGQRAAQRARTHGGHGRVDYREQRGASSDPRGCGRARDCGAWRHRAPGHRSAPRPAARGCAAGPSAAYRARTAAARRRRATPAAAHRRRSRGDRACRADRSAAARRWRARNARARAHARPCPCRRARQARAPGDSASSSSAGRSRSSSASSASGSSSSLTREAAGGQFQPGEGRSASLLAPERGQQRLAPLLEQRLVGDGAGRDDAHDLPLHGSAGLSRLAELLADAPPIRRGARAVPGTSRRCVPERLPWARSRRRTGRARSARCRATARRDGRRRRTSRRSRPCDRTAAHPDARP